MNKKENNIGSFLKETAPRIDSEIEKLFPREIRKEWLEDALGKARFEYSPETATKSIAEPIWDFLDRGGKRWRPALMLLACEAVGGNSKNFFPFVSMPELIHEGTCAADDLEDNSQQRRGKPCLHLIYGNDIALNDSNILYFIPLLLLYKNPLKLDTKTLLKIYDLYAEEMIRVSVGQGMDIYWHKGKEVNITEKEYLQMCLCKTGVLARFSTKLGGILGKASKKQIVALAEFGESIGVAFQIQDDILNLVGEEFQKGKGVGEDIHEGKRTLLVLYALKNSSEQEKERLVEILNSHPTDEKVIAEAIEIIKKSGAIDYSKGVAKKLVRDAWSGIDKVLKKSVAKEKLRQFADYLIEREI
jgi:geranylgeranyl diphosphate synthase type I